MKRLSFVFMTFASVLLSMVSCEKGPLTNEEKLAMEKIHTVFTSVSQSGERTTLDSELKYVWTATDQVMVYTLSTPEGDVFSLTKGAGSTTATFEGETAETGPYLAAYPASLVSSNDGYNLTFDVPYSQKYTPNSFADNAVPIIAYADCKELAFKNTTGFLRLALTGEGTIKKMVLSDKNVGVRLWGKFGLKPTDESISFISGGSNEISVDFSDKPDGIALDASNPTYFYFSLPVNTLANGFTVTMMDAENKEAYINYDNTDKKVANGVCKTYATSVSFNIQYDRPQCQIDMSNSEILHIGNQIWMKYNMRCYEYDSESEMRGQSIQPMGTQSGVTFEPRYVAYNISTKGGRWSDLYEYEYHYTWAAAMGYASGNEAKEITGELQRRQGICPNGWHVPCYSEFKELYDFVDSEKGTNTSGKHLKSKDYWNGDDIYGFGTLPTGYSIGSNVCDVNNMTNYWCSTATNNCEEAYHTWTFGYQNYMNLGPDGKGVGSTVRCIKD